MRKKVIVSILVFGMIFALHSTPHIALRTYVFFSGYPTIALTTSIIEDEYHNEIDKEMFEELNAKAYTLTTPPIEKATQGELRNFLVKKYGLFHIVEFYGEG